MFAFAPKTFTRIVRISAIYDLLVTAPFATPWSFAIARGQLSAINRQLGGAALPSFEPFHVLFACLLGSVVLMWAVLRIGDPQHKFGRYDGAGRMLFSIWMMWAWAATGAPLLWLFLVPELGFALAQWLPVARTGSAVQGF